MGAAIIRAVAAAAISLIRGKPIVLSAEQREEIATSEPIGGV